MAGRSGNADGFTLIELMVVLVIFGLMSAAVVLALPDAGGGLIGEAERFAARARAAQERAIMDNRPVALRLTAAGYQFEWAVKGAWQPLDAEPFEAQRWREGTKAAAADDRIVFDSTGFADPLEVTLTREDDRVAVEVADGGDIRVRR
jgi:general secretion pathway protein H